MVIIEDSKASIDKQFQNQSRNNQKKMAHLMQLKKEM